MPQGPKKNICLIDTQQKVHQTMQQAFEDSPHRLMCFESGRLCLEHLTRQHCHLLFADINIPDINGLDVLEEVKSINPAINVVMMAHEPEIPTVVEAIKAGAWDFIEKPLTKKKVTEIDQKLNGLSSEQNEELDSLSAAEMRVLTYILQGYSNKEAARKLSRSIRTIEVHRSNIMKKMKVTNIVELVKKAIKLGLIDLDD